MFSHESWQQETHVLSPPVFLPSTCCLQGQALEATVATSQSLDLATAHYGCLDATLILCKIMGEVMGPADAARSVELLFCA